MSAKLRPPEALVVPAAAASTEIAISILAEMTAVKNGVRTKAGLRPMKATAGCGVG